MPLPLPTPPLPTLQFLSIHSSPEAEVQGAAAGQRSRKIMFHGVCSAKSSCWMHTTDLDPDRYRNKAGVLWFVFHDMILGIYLPVLREPNNRIHIQIYLGIIKHPCAGSFQVRFKFSGYDGVAMARLRNV